LWIGFATEYSEERVKFARAARFNCLEVMMNPGTELDLMKIKEDKIKQVTEVFEKNEIGIAIIQCSVNHLDGDFIRRRENNAYFCRAIELCQKFGTNVVSTNTWGDKDKSIKDNLPVYREVFSRYAKVAEDNNVKIAMENCPHAGGYPLKIGNIGYSPGIWKILFEEVPS